MSTAVKVPPITADQYLNFKAPEGFRDELIEGEIVVAPMPEPLHHDIVENINSLLKAGLERSEFKVGTAINMDMREDYSMPVPDVWVMQKARWRAALEQNSYPKGSPELAIEVMSRANTRRHILQKVLLYLKNGSKAVWVVFPKGKRIEAYYPGQEAPSIHEKSVETPPPIPHVSLQFESIFKVG